MPGRPETGCCTLGAHFSDRDGRKRVEGFASKLTSADWQYHDVGKRKGIVGRDDEGKKQARVVNGACVSLNRDTLVELMGAPAYAILAKRCCARIEAANAVRTEGRRSFALQPADPGQGS